jgi:hypothetical protein
MVHPPPGTCEGGEEQRQYLFIYLFIYLLISNFHVKEIIFERNQAL